MMMRAENKAMLIDAIENVLGITAIATLAAQVCAVSLCASLHFAPDLIHYLRTHKNVAAFCFAVYIWVTWWTLAIWWGGAAVQWYIEYRIKTPATAHKGFPVIF